MKTSIIVVAILSAGIGIIRADQTLNSAATTAATIQQSGAVPAPTARRVVDRGSNHRIWQWETFEKAPNGKAVPHVHKYTELGTGMHYQDANGQWVETKEQINIQPDGTAAATQGQHQVYFPGNVNQGAIHLVTPDGQHLKSRPLGIGYDDGTQTVMLAQLKDSTGQVVNNNQVVYPDCFTGLKADLLYTYKQGSFEQDVVLHEQPPDPASLGLNPDTTKLQVLTEFFDAPKPKVETHPAKKAGGVTDTALHFGNTIMGRGRAFLVGDESNQSQPSKDDVFVYKSWTKAQGRTFLIEEVPLTQAEPQLQTLPRTSSNFKSLPDSMLCKATKTRWLPAVQAVQTSTNRIQLAKAGFKPAPAFVMDYIELNTDTGDLVLQGDTTYYLSYTVNVGGNLTIEGGTVVKFNANMTFNCWGAVICDTGPYRPGVFTYSGDTTVGEDIGIYGDPNYDYDPFYINDDATPLSNLRISYARYALHDHSLTLKDSQLVNCTYGILAEWWGGGGYSCYVTNVLMSNVQVPFLGMDFSVFGCNLTIAGCQQLGADWLYSGSDTMTFVNSLLVGVTDYGPATIITNYTACPADNSIFQTVGAGSYYLPTNSPYHNQGTTNLDSETLADLAAKTTYPPIVYSNTTISVATTLSPQAQRDYVGNPDLGYHYDPLDYVFGGCDLYTNLIITASTTIGWFEDYGSVSSSGQPYGISLNDGANLTMAGSASQPCWFVRHNTTQESVNGAWRTLGWMGGLMLNGSGSVATPMINAQFTKWSNMQGFNNYWRDNWNYGVACLKNCEFYNGGMSSYAPSMYFTNCLFSRAGIAFWSQTASGSFTFQNCTFNEGMLAVCRGYWQAPSTNTIWRVKNTAFDGTAFNWYDCYNGNTNYTELDYNSYNTNNLNWQTYPFPYPPVYGILETAGAHDVMVTNYNWQSSWLGNYYLPTGSQLINAGSTTSDQVGLYHFTTQTNQVKETNSVVDIGYHYVATDAYGNPLDTNGDGVPDYLEDVNGNGLWDSGEIDWRAYDTSLKVLIARPRNGGTIP